MGNINTQKGVHYSSRLNDVLVRLTLAHARLHLKDEPDFTDVKRAVELMKVSFKSLGVYDDFQGFDVIKTEKVESQSFMDKRRAILELLKHAENEEMLEVDLESKTKFSDFDEVMEKIRMKGDIFEPRIGLVKINRGGK